MKRGLEMVRRLGEDQIIEINRTGDDSYTLQTKISNEESVSKIDKQKVYRGTKKHFTKLYERDVANHPEEKEVYYDLDEETEKPLDMYRLSSNDKQSKQVILDGLMELLFLVSEGKIYDIELNPFNFIISTDEKEGSRVKAFYRQDRELSEITDEWLLQVKKVIGYFLVSDTKFSEENYSKLKPKDFYSEMEEGIAEQYLRIMRSTSVDDMAREWFTDKVYKQLKGFPSMLRNAKKPKNVTSVDVALGLEDVDNEDVEEEKEVIEPISNEVEKPKKKEKEQGLLKNPLVRYGAIALVAILVIFLFVKVVGGFGDKVDDIDEGTKEEGEQEKVEDEEDETVEMVDDDFYGGIVKASVQKYEEAAEMFDEMDEESINSLGEDEQASIYLTYIKVGKYDKALSVREEGEETLVKYLKQRDKIEDVKDIEYDGDVINFEKAVVEKEWEKVLELKDKVKDREDRQVSVLKAYVHSGNLDDAIGYVKDTDKGLKGKLEKEYDKYAKEEKISKKAKKKAKKKIKAIK